MKKNILISGGAGFIGTNLYYGLKKDYNITLVDNFSSTKKTWLDKNLVHHLNIASNKKLNIFLSKKKFHAIIHSAALFANQKSIDQPLNDLKSNIVGTLNLLNFCKIKEIKLIYFSSSCVYSTYNTDEKIREPSFDTPYAISKFTAEQYCSFYSKYYNLDIISLRLFNIFGEFDYYGNYRNVIPNFIKNSLENKNITLFNNGNDSRDFTYVGDLVKATKILLNKKKLKGTYNFGFNNPIKIKKLANYIKQKIKSDSKIVLSKKSRKWDKTRSRKSNSIKLHEVLPNFKNTNFFQALNKTLEWYKNNKYK